MVTFVMVRVGMFVLGLALLAVWGAGLAVGTLDWLLSLDLIAGLVSLIGCAYLMLAVGLGAREWRAARQMER